MSASKFNFIVTFIVICALSAFIGWCGGYDFDHRSSGVGVWVFTTICLATFFGCMVAEMTREELK